MKRILQAALVCAALPAFIADPAEADRLDADPDQPHWIYVFHGSQDWCFFVADAHPIVDEFGYLKFRSVQNGVNISISSAMRHIILSRKIEMPIYYSRSWRECAFGEN